MKTATLMKWIAASTMAVALTAYAQTPGTSGGQGGQHERPSPDKIAAHLLEKFDANKDGELEQGELVQAITAFREKMQQHRAQGGGQRSPPSPEKLAEHMIEKFSSDKKGLTESELAKAIEEHQANRPAGAGGGRQHPGGHGQTGTPAAKSV